MQALGVTHFQRYSFQFQRVYGPESSQREVFECVRPLISHALEGVNCSIIAYGQTGSGKTYTISGDHRQRGIIPRTLESLFGAIDGHRDVDFRVSLSFIEVRRPFSRLFRGSLMVFQGFCSMSWLFRGLQGGGLRPALQGLRPGSLAGGHRGPAGRRGCSTRRL